MSACRNLGGLALAVLLLPVAGAQAGEAGAQDHPVQQDLRDVGAELERERRLVERLQHESSSLLQTVAELERELHEAESDFGRSQQQLVELEARLRDSRWQREQAASSSEMLRERLRSRLRLLYRLGELGWLNALFAEGALSEGPRRLYLLSRAARADRALIDEVGRSRLELVETERRIELQLVEQQRLAAQVRQRRQRAEAARREQAAALELVRRRRALHAKAMTELDRARSRLVVLVSAIEGAPRAASGFATWQGRLPAPLVGARIEVAFGRQLDERFGTVTLNQGVDLRAPKGSPVVAVYPGTVAFADAFEGYGLLVILDHGGGYYTLYAHLGAFSVTKGQRVRQRQAIGTLGESGSLKGPYLYFEVRQGGKAVDPQVWVRLPGAGGGG